MSSESAFCNTHPLGYIGKDSFGHWYTTCYTGKKLKDKGEDPKCEIVVESIEK